jgi:o-succinylbenzoate synthase
MRTLIDFEHALTFAIPALNRSGGRSVREGMLLEGPQGWGEFSPLGDDDAAAWLTAATEPGTVGWPDTLRGRVPVSVPVPAVAPEAARELVTRAGCGTADVVVADRPDSLTDDIARLEAVRDALGRAGAIRCIAQRAWDVDTGVHAIDAMVRAVGELEFVQDPCRTMEESAALRRKVDVRVAMNVVDRVDPWLTEAADVLVLASGPLGGVRRALRVGERIGLPCVVSSTLETSVGLAAGLALAGALPELPFACGLGTRLWMSGDLVSAPRSLLPVDGYLPVAPMPPAPDRELVERYALTDPGRLTEWRKRLHACISHR